MQEACLLQRTSFGACETNPCIRIGGLQVALYLLWWNRFRIKALQTSRRLACCTGPPLAQECGMREISQTSWRGGLHVAHWCCSTGLPRLECAEHLHGTSCVSRRACGQWRSSRKRTLWTSATAKGAARRVTCAKVPASKVSAQGSLFSRSACLALGGLPACVMSSSGGLPRVYSCSLPLLFE